MVILVFFVAINLGYEVGQLMWYQQACFPEELTCEDYSNEKF